MLKLLCELNIKRRLALMLFIVFWATWIFTAVSNEINPSEVISLYLPILLIKPIAVTVLVFLSHSLGLLDDKKENN